MRRAATAAFVAFAVAVLATGCGSSHEQSIKPSASAWLSHQVDAARDAASHERFDEAIADIEAIEKSVDTLRAQHSISDSRAREVQTAAHNALLAVAALTTTSTTTSTSPTTRPEQPAPNPGKGHDRKRHGDANSD